MSWLAYPPTNGCRASLTVPLHAEPFGLPGVSLFSRPLSMPVCPRVSKPRAPSGLAPTRHTVAQLSSGVSTPHARKLTTCFIMYQYRSDGSPHGRGSTRYTPRAHTSLAARLGCLRSTASVGLPCDPRGTTAGATPLSLLYTVTLALPFCTARLERPWSQPFFL